MVNSAVVLYCYSRNRGGLLKTFFFIPTTLALLTTLFILVYISTTSHFFFLTYHHQHNNPTPLIFKKNPSSLKSLPVVPLSFNSHGQSFVASPKSAAGGGGDGGDSGGRVSQRSGKVGLEAIGNHVNNDVFHDRDIFQEDYNQMNRSFKVYVYPHSRNDPFANIFLPVDFEPGGNYASESYFKKVLMKSHFITKDSSQADLFFLPFSIARMRHDPRIGTKGIPDFISHYMFNISQKYPYWNRTGGADHFYVACHSIGRFAMEKASEVKLNVIQVVCSSSYFLSGYFAHKDVCLPQIWPRQEDPLKPASLKRNKLAFFAGEINSPVREKLLQVWRNDSEIYAHFGRLKTPYADELLGSKFCLHVKGFEVNTARIADSLYYGCVPVIIANHYDLPFTDILNWKSFSVVVATLDIPLLKKILKGIRLEEYSLLQSNVIKVRKHFQWHLFPSDYDAFYMVMYELWLRRSSFKILLSISPSN